MSEQPDNAIAQPIWIPWTRRGSVLGLLLIYAAVSLSAAWNKSGTFDEHVILNNGRTYWETGDFRMSPDATLTQYWLSIPLHFSSFSSSILDHPNW